MKECKVVAGRALIPGSGAWQEIAISAAAIGRRPMGLAFSSPALRFRTARSRIAARRTPEKRPPLRSMIVFARRP